MRGRLIPARAGNTISGRSPVFTPSAHPRSRGEHNGVIWIRAYTLGSSPLARGTPRIAHLSGKRVRLIPARAGNTPRLQIPQSSSPAHPRSRGEHRLRYGRVRLSLGSSPLARGTLVVWRLQFTTNRLIPARAGNTLADMGFYPLHQQNRITLEPEPASRIHDKQPLLTPASTAILTRLTPP